MPEAIPRARGVRLEYAKTPEHFRAWITNRFGEPSQVVEHAGGMSPGCAASLYFDSEGAIFVKAVSREMNERTVELFEFERDLLSRLPVVDYRSVLVDSYESAGWIALVFENIDGRYPRFDDVSDFDAVRDVIVRQTKELTPPPANTLATGVVENAERWIARWQELEALRPAVVPDWVWADFDSLHDRVEGLAGQLPSQTLCHFDIRDDNVLIRPEGSAVIVDWGIARTGPVWLDVVQLSVQLNDPVAAANAIRANVASKHLAAATTLVLTYAGSQSWNGEQDWHATLPNMGAFARDDAARLFAVAQQLL
jgi:aminoglycoside phosphotransferase (APT) family kinase protein